jgi:hypothetical protein
VHRLRAAYNFVKVIFPNDVIDKGGCNFGSSQRIFGSSVEDLCGKCFKKWLVVLVVCLGVIFPKLGD